MDPEVDRSRAAPAGVDVVAGFATPTGEPCPRQLVEDGSVEGSGCCYGCGSCLLLEQAAWPSHRQTG